jgi:hypothetical protein
MIITSITPPLGLSHMLTFSEWAENSRFRKPRTEMCVPMLDDEVMKTMNEW